MCDFAKYKWKVFFFEESVDFSNNFVKLELRNKNPSIPESAMDLNIKQG